MKELLYSEFQKNNIDIEQDVFNYGISVLKEQFICIFISLIISYVLKTVREFFLFLLLFIPIRVNLGGYHCKTKINCYICSVSSCILFPTLIKCVSIPWWRSHPIHKNRATESIWTEPCNPLLRAAKSTKRATFNL